MADPRPLGALLAEATARSIADPALVKAAAEEVNRTHFRQEDLFAAGPTSNSEGMLTRIEIALETYAANKQKVPARTLAEKKDWEGRVAIGRERDRLHREAQVIYPGCICLMFGGRYVSYGLTVATPDGRTISDPEVLVYRDRCPCPAGVADAERIAVEKARLLADDRQRRLGRLWLDLKLPDGLGDGITFETHPDQAKMRTIDRWYRGDFKAGLVLAGENQRGKTTTGYLLAKRAVEDGLGVIAMPFVDLLEKLTDTFHHDERLKADLDQPAQATHAALIASLQSVDFLMLDDLGAEKLTPYVERALYQILNTRADRGLRTVLTTNLKHGELMERYGARIYSRIAKLCSRVLFQMAMIGPASGGLETLKDLDDEP